VNAGATTQLVIEKAKPDIFVNVGFCGGFKAEVSVGDTVLVTDVVQYDFDLTLFGRKLGFIPGISCVRLPLTVINITNSIFKSGTFLKGDRVFQDKNYATRLYKLFKPSVIEMELGAIAQVCILNKIKLVSLKIPTDIEENEDQSDWKNNFKKMFQNNL